MDYKAQSALRVLALKKHLKIGTLVMTGFTSIYPDTTKPSECIVYIDGIRLKDPRQWGIVLDEVIEIYKSKGRWSYGDQQEMSNV